MLVTVDLAIKILTIFGTLTGFLILVIVRIIKTAKRITMQDGKIVEVEKTLSLRIDAVDEKHETANEERRLQILTIEAMIEGVKDANNKQHELLFRKIDGVDDKIDVVGKGISEINGYLKGLEKKVK